MTHLHEFTHSVRTFLQESADMGWVPELIACISRFTRQICQEWCNQLGASLKQTLPRLQNRNQEEWLTWISLYDCGLTVCFASIYSNWHYLTIYSSVHSSLPVFQINMSSCWVCTRSFNLPKSSLTSIDGMAMLKRASFGKQLWAQTLLTCLVYDPKSPYVKCWMEWRLNDAPGHKVRARKSCRKCNCLTVQSKSIEQQVTASN